MDKRNKNINQFIEDFDIDNDIKFKRRENKLFSSIERPKINNLNKLIIPYDFELKKYNIKENEIAFYEKKDYLLSKLNEWNNLDLFKLDDNYHPSFCQNFILIVLFLFTNLLYLIISIFFICLFMFNPAFIFVIVILFIKINQILKIIKYICLDNFKLSKINKLILNENCSDFCKENKLKWTYGESGYWIELSKQF